jgi:chromosome segregation ATPase
MKKINEDVAITDPNLAQQYSNGKQQLVNKDSQINGLNKQILKLQQDKIKIQQALDQIEKKYADMVGKPAEPTTAQQPQNSQNTDLAKAQQALAAQVLMNKPTTESLYINNLTSKLHALKEIMHSSSNPDAIKLEINEIESEIHHLTEAPENPFASDVFYNVSESYEDDDNDILDK